MMEARDYRVCGGSLLRGHAVWMFVAVVLGVGSLGALDAPPAGATKAPVFDFGSAAPPGEGDRFIQARGIAVNETGNGGVPMGTVYVTDNTLQRVQSFDADGGFLRAWGWDVIESGKPNDTLGDEFEICTVATECKAGVPGSGAGQLSSPAGGIAVNQTSGDVYVLDRGNSRIEEFSATGTFVRTWGSPGTGAGQFSFGAAIAGIGIDSSGNVYVADNENRRVQKFDSEGHFLAMAGTGGLGAGQFAIEPALCCPNYLTVAPSGDVYVVGRSDGTIYHFTSSLAFDGGFVPPSVPGGAGENTRNALAFDPGTGRLYFTKKNSSIIYGLNPVTQLIEEEIAAGGSEWVGLAVNGSTGRVYGTRTTNATFVRVFDEGLPEPQCQVPSAVSGTKATLNCSVNPNGTELKSGTEGCRFEWGEGNALDHTEPCDKSAGEIGNGTSPVALHAAISGLIPKTEYSFRLVVATTTNKIVPSNPTQHLTTAESVVTKLPTAITGTSARLNGEVDPEGVGLLECFFEYGTTSEYGQSASCEAPDAAEVGAGSGFVPVHANVALDPGTAYHYRLVAIYDYPVPPTGRGADESFQSLGPVIGDTWSESVGVSEATLKAEINPKGKPATYHFEYGAQGPCESNPCARVPVPDASAGGDEVMHIVSAPVEGLSSGTTYHYRVVATNVDAVNTGLDHTFTTAGASVADSCANSVFRIGPGARLPDCRAYEMVSPVDKGGGDIVAAETFGAGVTNLTQAAVEGDRLTYTSSTNFGDAVRGAYAAQYLATRGGSGWTSHALNPPQGATVFDPNFELEPDLQNAFQAFTPDLCHALIVDQNLNPLTTDAIHGYTDTYWRDNCGVGADSYEAVTTGDPPTSSGQGTNLLSQARNYSDDRCQVILMSTSAMTLDAASGDLNNQQIYDLSCDGERHLVSKLPNGQASTVFSRVGSGAGQAATHGYALASAVSRGATRVFWTTSSNGPGSLYVRLNPAADETTVVDGSANCVPDPVLACTVPISVNAARFWMADSEGETAIFSVGEELYEYDVETQTKTQIAGEVLGVVGGAEDLSRLYFTSKEVLAPGAVSGQVNLYLRQDGVEILVAELAEADSAPNESRPGVDAPLPESRLSRVTPDGRHLAFTSLSAVLADETAGYDNTDVVTGEPDAEVYLYDADADRLVCASCNPSGARPHGQLATAGGVPAPTAARIVGWQWSNIVSRNLLPDGSRLFFESYDSLVPADRNEELDVYEWEAPGTGPAVGGCAPTSPSFSVQNGGCVSLISTGTSRRPSSFVDSSASGKDVFFSTDSSIDSRDPGLVDIYDAREGGGFAPPPEEPSPCVGDSCQSIPAAPGYQSPSSLGFEGPGNLVEKVAVRCPKGKHRVRKSGKTRCVAKHKHRSHERHRRRAGHEQGRSR